VDKWPFDINDRFYRYSRYLEQKFGVKVQKVSVDAGFTCPNLDGTISTGGCIYCNNQGFKPKYCQPSVSIADQINQGIAFFERKRHYHYLAYFQSYTNTHTTPPILREVLMQAAENNNVVGIIVSTRPDCVPDEILTVLQEINTLKPLMLEFGVESTLERSLKVLNRHHSYQQVCDTVLRTTDAGIDTGAHIILGLPGETREEIVNHAVELSKLPLSTVKLHQLQIVKNTALANMYHANPKSIPLIDWPEYVELCCDFLELLRPDIAIERFASQTTPELLAVQYWKGVRNHHITHLVQNKLAERESFQGKFWTAL
jgi:hypothetical protein